MTWIEQLQQNAPLVILIGVMVVAAAVSNRSCDLGWLDFRPKNYYRGRKMEQKQRLDHVLNLLTYDFTDRIENRVYHGEISRSEAKEVYRRLRLGFPKVRNIFPSPEYLKETIKKRLGTHVTAKLPDQKPVVKRRHMFERVV